MGTNLRNDVAAPGDWGDTINTLGYQGRGYGRSDNVCRHLTTRFRTFT